MKKDEILKLFPIKEKVLFLTKAGSFLYGTNSEKSDTDIKGVFLPDLNDLILKKSPNHYNFKTGDSHSRNTSEDIDVTFYSLQYFLELASKGETNALDMLFSFTNKDAVIFKDDIWDILINGIDNIVTKNVNSYLGFCKSQAVKYSIKGEKLNNFKTFESFCKKHYDEKNDNGAPITLKTALQKYIFLDDKKLPLVGEDRKFFSDCLINNIPRDIDGNFLMKCSSAISFPDKSLDFFGEHAYFVTADNKEVYLQISGVKFQLQDSIKSSYHKVLKVINSYGVRAENAASDNGADYKALSHAIRVLYQTEELLTTGMIKFPLGNKDFVKSIKYKETDMKYDDIINFITERMEYIDNEIIPNSNLKSKSNYKWIENYILSCYDIK